MWASAAALQEEFEAVEPRSPGRVTIPSGPGTRSRTYVCNAESHCIDVFEDDDDLLFSFGEFGSGPGQFNEPGDVAVVVLPSPRRNSRCHVAQRSVRGGCGSRQPSSAALQSRRSSARDNRSLVGTPPACRPRRSVGLAVLPRQPAAADGAAVCTRVAFAVSLRYWRRRARGRSRSRARIASRFPDVAEHDTQRRRTRRARRLTAALDSRSHSRDGSVGGG